ncbi:MAG TPA: phosphoenolpyruvate--protein phosphotransferase, partial [Verrucomicrobia subdivision 3 bacterium]|nr:phosphoenolpyruvate--protein phosphotransferase [Limisphaerales bacterium]
MNSTDNEPTVPAMILGEVASSGLARGRALLCDCAKQTVVPRRQVSETEAQKELARFDAAVTAAEKKLLEVQASVRRTLGKAESEIFEVQILLMRDAQLRDAVRDRCLEKRMNVEAALDEAIQHLMVLFGRLEDPYFRERAADLHDVGKRLLDHLAKNLQPGIPVLPDGCVLVTSELFASVVAQLEGHGVRGLIVEKGGLTAHATILARALGIPMLVRVPEATEKIRAGDLVIVDALAGRIFINPKPELLRTYDQLEADLQIHQSSLKSLIDLPTVTQDGVEIKLSANIGQTADAVSAASVKADGAGLYRTEFIFLVQDHFPSEEEQYHLYRATAEHLQPGETVIRVLDIGSDKPLSYFPLTREANPALGCRGTRLLLAHPTVLHTQLRAILRLSASHPVAILLPMIGGVDELRAAKAALESVKAELAAAGQPFNSRIPLGAMVETPSAAILIGQLAAEVDFFSVGTNDLVQYLLAADRIGGELASAYEPLHPAVLQVLATLATAAKAKGKPICLCGEIASDPAYTTLLLGLGFRSFSVSPGRLLEIKHAIRSTRLSEAEELAGRVLPLTSIREIKAHLQKDWNRRRPVSSPEIRTSATAPTTPLAVTHNAKLQRFEAQAGDAPLAFLSYTQEGERVILDHMFVPDELRGRGMAATLARAALG